MAILKAKTLTRRQGEVLSYIAQGYTDKEIAASLVLSVNTVRRHVSNLFVSLNANTRAHAVAIAGRHVGRGE